jgi:hypothetical protein
MRRQFVLGILALLVAFALYSSFSAKPSGCPVEVDRSTEDAQVFLMGTIGGAYEDPKRDCWREETVQPVLDELGVSYFNPVVSNWTEENAEIEARVIAQAETIVLVITAKHPSIGSLAESGWAVLSAIERGQTIIIYIAPDSSNEESWRARQIVLSQAYPLAENLDNVLIVDSLDEVVVALRQRYRN